MDGRWMFISDDVQVQITNEGWLALAEYARLLHGWHPNPERVDEIRKKFIRQGGARAKRIVDRMEDERMAVEYLCKIIAFALKQEPVVFGREG